MVSIQGNIIGIFVDDREVSSDRDLIGESFFDVVTSRDNRYRISRESGDPRSFAWTVSQTRKADVVVDILTGRVIGVRSLFARRPSAFSYVSARNVLDSGNQNDFLNAVQSLTD